MQGLLPLYLLGLPLTHVALWAVSRLATELYFVDEFVFSPVAEGVCLWAALSVAGWLQWFVLLPLVVRLLRRLVRRAATGQ